MVKNFKKGYTGDYGITMSLGKLKILCELEWSTFGVGWLAKGRLDRSLVQKVWQVVTRDLGHPDQFPYIDTWLTLILHPPLWLRGQISSMLVA